MENEELLMILEKKMRELQEPEPKDLATWTYKQRMQRVKDFFDNTELEDYTDNEDTSNNLPQPSQSTLDVLNKYNTGSNNYNTGSNNYSRVLPKTQHSYSNYDYDYKPKRKRSNWLNNHPIFKWGCLTPIIVILLLAWIGNSFSDSDDKDSTDSSTKSSVLSKSSSSKNSSSESKSSTPVPKAFNPKDYEPGATYDQLARNPDGYKGKKVAFTGEVLDISKNYFWDSDGILLYADGNMNNVLMIKVPEGVSYSGILEKDKITVYGTSNGSNDYTTVLGAAETVPEVIADKFQGYGRAPDEYTTF